MPKILTQYEQEIYNLMKAKAYKQPSNVWYTTADLLSQIDHALLGEEQKYLGTKFSYYASYHQSKFEIKKTSGNNKYRTRRDDE